MPSAELKALVFSTSAAYRDGALWRARLGLKDQRSSFFDWQMTWNLEALTGAAARDPFLRTLWQAPSGVDAWAAEHRWQRRDALARLRLHRWRFSYFSPRSELHAGRLRIAWGVGEIWTLLDRFHTAPVTALEPEEVPGADGIDARWRTPAGEFRLSFAPGKRARQSVHRFAAGWRAPWVHLDVSLVGMRIGSERLVGASAAGNWQEMTWHAVLAHSFWPHAQGLRLLLGLDGHLLHPEIDWGMELVQDETVGKVPAEPALLLALARRQLGLRLGWQAHPLVRLELWALGASTNDRALQATLQASLADDWQAQTFMRWTRKGAKAIYGQGRIVVVSVSYFH